MDIRIDVDLRHHPKFRKVVRELGSDGGLALIWLWAWARKYRPSGALTGMSRADITDAAGFTGDPELFTNTLHAHGWFEEEPLGTFVLHDWHEHQPFLENELARKTAARKAASARWNRHAPPTPKSGKGGRGASGQAGDNPGDKVGIDSDNDAPAMRSQCDPYANRNARIVSFRSVSDESLSTPPGSRPSGSTLPEGDPRPDGGGAAPESPETAAIAGLLADGGSPESLESTAIVVISERIVPKPEQPVLVMQGEEWAPALREVRAELDRLAVPAELYDPVFWLRMIQAYGDERTKTGILDELAKMLAHFAAEPKRKRNWKATFRNWLKTAIRWEERDAAREAIRKERSGSERDGGRGRPR